MPLFFFPKRRPAPPLAQGMSAKPAHCFAPLARVVIVGEGRAPARILSAPRTTFAGDLEFKVRRLSDGTIVWVNARDLRPMGQARFTVIDGGRT